MKVFTVGVFDLLHIGHVKLFERAKALGDELIVAIQDDENAIKFKPQAKLFYTACERKYFVESIRFVDRVMFYDTVDKIIQNIDFDILVVGPDQNNEKFLKAFEWCKDNNKTIIVLPRTENISSSLLRGNKS
ncbi:MAG: adenylyltransferase/cytidyltransferase family protein [Muribaculaceae bacterium]|nr:adenylyltransferase/cytidyltransferase family protein [Muribaculaceae bacterium]